MKLDVAIVEEVMEYVVEMFEMMKLVEDTFGKMERVVEEMMELVVEVDEEKVVLVVGMVEEMM
jgi:hypothetical protein